MAVLDAHLFPHLLSIVVAWAPADSLVAFRGVSKTLRAAADDRLFRHVQLVFPTSGGVSVRPYCTSSVLLPWLDSTDGNAYTKSLMDGVEVIDVPYPAFEAASNEATVLLYKYLAEAYNVNSPVPVARLLGGVRTGNPSPKDWDGRAETHIVFGDAWLNWPFRLVRVLHARSDEIASGTFVPISLDASGIFDSNNQALVEEHVVHLIELDEPPDGELNNTQAPGAPTHVRGGANYPGSVGDPEDNSVLHQLLFGNWSDEAHITIVGGARALREFLGLDPAATRADFEAAMDEYEERIDCGRPWRHLITFVSPEQYEASVGLATVKLETRSTSNAAPPRYVR